MFDHIGSEETFDRQKDLVRTAINTYFFNKTISDLGTSVISRFLSTPEKKTIEETLENPYQSNIFFASRLLKGGIFGKKILGI